MPSISKVAFAVLGVILGLSGCKTRGPENEEILSTGVATKSLDGFRTVVCSPTKTIYFHWMRDYVAAYWFDQSGASAVLKGSELSPRRKSWFPFTPMLFDQNYNASSQTRSVCGPGLYLSGGPTDASEFGDTLILFRIQGSPPKGPFCKKAELGECSKLNYNTTGDARASLPLLTLYNIEFGRMWYHMARLANESKGEHVEFDIPRQGDAEAIAKELIDGKTVSEVLSNLAEVAPLGMTWGKRPTAGLCQKTPPSPSLAFLKELHCDAIPERFDQLMKKLAPNPNADIPKEQLESLWAIQRNYEPDRINSPKALKIFRSYYWLPLPNGAGTAVP